jgi:hypothetical protein
MAISTSVVHTLDQPERLIRRRVVPAFRPVPGEESQVILSFDVEEHHRIEAAAGLDVGPVLKAHYDGRVAPPT